MNKLRAIPKTRTRLSKKGNQFTANPQKKSEVAEDSAQFDNSIENIKKPKSNLDVTQKIATTGETIPLVFGKRSNDIGGIWLQPSLIKAGTKSFVNKLLFAVSQGEITSSPVKSKTFIGLTRVNFLDDTSISLTHIYSTAASLASSPNSCPISSSDLYCGNDIYTYLNPVIPASTGSALYINYDYKVDYFGERSLTVGTGDTSNTTFSGTLQVFDAETGDDVTSGYVSTFGGNTFTLNQRFNTSAPFNLLGGQTVGTVQDYIASNNGELFEPINSTTVAAGTYPQSMLDDINSISSGRSKFIFKYIFGSVNTQTVSSSPASTGTLTGVQDEITIGTSTTIQNTSNNNSSYADITFLAVSGSLFDQPTRGTFPTDAKQLYIFYEEGIKVDKFSAGLSSGSYTNGSSNQFLDLAMHLFKLYKKIDGANTASIVAPVDVSNIQSLSTFCTNNGMFFNGIIDKAVNIVEYISKVSLFYFLSFISIGGKYKFLPILPITGSNTIDNTALTPVTTFTEANIIQGSFQKGYLSVEARRDFIANCIYTDCIPTEVARRKTTSVRFTSTSLDAPIEQFDLSDFCTSVDHAILYAKYELSRRKHSTHNISFQTDLFTTTLEPTNIIKLQLQRTNSVGDDRTEINYYQITSITYENNGISEIEASHFPLNGSNISEITNEITTGTYTILQ
jgi:hypothetical protein